MDLDALPLDAIVIEVFQADAVEFPRLLVLQELKVQKALAHLLKESRSELDSDHQDAKQRA